jgi:hypothetical protein
MSSVAGQNHQYKGRKDNEDTPLPVECILTFEPLTCNSATSSLTTATAHFEEEEGSADNQKLPAELRLFDNSPFPVKKKMLSNFDVFSGNESD